MVLVKEPRTQTYEIKIPREELMLIYKNAHEKSVETGEDIDLLVSFELERRILRLINADAERAIYGKETNRKNTRLLG